MSRLVPFLALGGLVAAAVAGILLSGERSPRYTIASVQAALDEDARLARFSGRIGDFMVYKTAIDGTVPSEPEIFNCPGGTPPITDMAVLRENELWSDALGPTGIGWSCEGDIILTNNEGLEGRPGPTLLAKGYVREVPVPLLRDAPQERLEQIEIEGHPALLERPVEGFPWPVASVVAIERYPEGATPGIAVFVVGAPSEAEAVAAAEALIEN
jgi:hypothetical protein